MAAESSESALPFRWVLTDSTGAVVSVDAEFTDQRFVDKAQAETWIGDVFSDLLAAGVDDVTLHEGDAVVYGPMSLHP